MSKADFLQETVRVYLVSFAITVVLSAGTALAGWAQDDIAFGTNPVISATSCSDNVTIGRGAGDVLNPGDNNIDIANNGIAGEANTIRIGTTGTHTAVFIAGISTTHLTSGVPVVVTGSGQLGILKSSARDKRDIRDMGEASSGLANLRPVTFHYEGDPIDTQQYGLIAEEVEKVYPELVTRGTDGKAETVAYHLLPVMLLNEVQRQFRQLAQKEAQIAGLERQLWLNDAQVAALFQQLRQRDSQLVAMHLQLDASKQEVDAVKQKVAQIDALAGRLGALERKASVSGSWHLSAAVR
jgi:endosialidase-like protein